MNAQAKAMYVAMAVRDADHYRLEMERYKKSTVKKLCNAYTLDFLKKVAPTDHPSTQTSSPLCQSVVKYVVEQYTAVIILIVKKTH